MWMCDICSGVNYRLPEWWEMPAEQEEDETLYQEENSGE